MEESRNLSWFLFLGGVPRRRQIKQLTTDTSHLKSHMEKSKTRVMFCKWTRSGIIILREGNQNKIDEPMYGSWASTYRPNVVDNLETGLN